MANATERIGIYRCGIHAEEQGRLFREQSVNDIGIDAYIEYVEDGEPRQLLALQIKSGVSWFSRAGVMFPSMVFRHVNIYIGREICCHVFLCFTTLRQKSVSGRN